MTKRIAFALVLAPCVIAFACLSALSARDDGQPNWKLLETRYAQASVALAKARLAMAQSQNKAVAGTISKEVMDELESGVQLTQGRLKQLEGPRVATSYEPQIAACEKVIQGLELNHSESLKANQLQAGAVSDVDLRREQAEIDVAKARLAALKSLFQQPPEVRIAWEIRMLQDDVRALWARPLLED